MVLINEWLPNPAGADAAGEWVELWNSGVSAVDLPGWKLTADGKKFFALSDILGPGQHAVIPRAESKLILRNTDGRLALYNNAGELADHAEFLGTAPEGKSVVRSGKNIFFGEPTPGFANYSGGNLAATIGNDHSMGALLPPTSATPVGVAGALLGTALALAAAIVFILRSYEDLSHIFFPGNGGPGRTTGG